MIRRVSVVWLLANARCFSMKEYLYFPKNGIKFVFSYLGNLKNQYTALNGILFENVKLCRGNSTKKYSTTSVLLQKKILLYLHLFDYISTTSRLKIEVNDQMYHQNNTVNFHLYYFPSFRVYPTFYWPKRNTEFSEKILQCRHTKLEH